MSPEDRNPDDPGRNNQHGRADGAAKAPGASSPSRPNAPWLRLILIAAGLVLAAVLGVMVLRLGPAAPPANSSSGTALIGGPFTMVDVDGRPVDESVLKGKWSLVFFGYTYCPDVCPATMTALSAAKARLGDRAADMQTVFVSVDPERDTPAQLKSYLESPAFPRPVIGLTGSPEQVKAMAQAYRVYYAKSGEGPGYLMDHNSAVYLMNPEGGFVRLVRPDAKPEEMAKEIGGALGLS